MTGLCCINVASNVSQEDGNIDLMKKWDEQSVVTAPTVVSHLDYDGECDASESGCHQSCDHSISSFVGLNCVSFDEVPQVREIPNRFDYTADEIESMWYGRREKDVMRDAAFGIAESLDYHYFQDEFGEPASTNFRGLESYTIEGSKQRKLFRLKNLIAVLREQRRQRACGELITNGPELIQAACHPVSSQCQRLAYKQAIRDEKDARGDATKSTTDTSPNMLLHLTRLMRDISN